MQSKRAVQWLQLLWSPFKLKEVRHCVCSTSGLQSGLFAGDRHASAEYFRGLQAVCKKVSIPSLAANPFSPLSGKMV